MILPSFIFVLKNQKRNVNYSSSKLDKALKTKNFITELVKVKNGWMLGQFLKLYITWNFSEFVYKDPVVKNT